MPNFVDGLLSQVNPDAEAYQSPEMLRREARDKIIAVQIDTKKKFDKKHCPGDVLDIGQIVYIRKPPSSTGESLKLQPKYRGPYSVIKRVSRDTYTLQEDRMTTLHISQIRYWGEPEDDFE